MVEVGRERTAKPVESGRWASASSTPSAHQVRTTASIAHYFSLPAGERLLSGADRSFAQKSPTGSNGSIAGRHERPYMDAPGLPSFQFMTAEREDCTRTFGLWFAAWPLSLMGFAGWLLNRLFRTQGTPAILGFANPRSNLSCHHCVIA